MPTDQTVRSLAMAAVCAACALTTSWGHAAGRAAAVPPTVSTTAAPGAIELAQVRFAPQLSLHGSTLQLNGAGIRHKLMFKVYAAGLYLPKKAHTLDEINAQEGPKRIRLVPLRTIDAEELSRLFLRSLENNTEKATFYRLAPSMLQISKVFTDIKKLQPGDELTMDWVPGTGTIVSHNGNVKSDTFTESMFFDALVGIWLGPRPADPTLKQALLGLPPD